MPQTEDR